MRNKFPIWQYIVAATIIVMHVGIAIVGVYHLLAGNFILGCCLASYVMILVISFLLYRAWDAPEVEEPTIGPYQVLESEYRVLKAKYENVLQQLKKYKDG